MVNFPFLSKKDTVNLPNSKGAAQRRYCFHLLSFVASMMLGGCASDSPGMTVQRNALEPWTNITNVQAGMSPFGQPAPMNPPGPGYITLFRPAAMSAKGNDLYLIDAGLRRIFRFDRLRQTMIPFATTLSAETGISIYAAPDTSLYVTDSALGKVLHFARAGFPLPPPISRGNLARPISATEAASTGQILVMGLYDQIIAFNSLGNTLNVIKPQHLLVIAAMTAEPQGIHAVNHLAKQVVELGRDGSFRNAVGTDPKSEPGSIAVSSDNLAFISDNFEQVIKVYRVQRTRG